MKMFKIELGSKSISPLRIRKTMGNIENPKTKIDLSECLISNKICFLETFLSTILLSKPFFSKTIQTLRNR